MHVIGAKVHPVLATTIAVLLFLSAGYAQSANTPDGQKIENKDDYNSSILLDLQQGPERRLDEARKLGVVAETGDPYAQYLLGTLYRLGKKHPSQLFERDDDKAAKYLSNAAVNGQVFAMAGMAEVELRRKQPMGAMIWAQAFAKYEAVYQEISNDKGGSHQAYAAFLIQRSFDELGHSDAVQKQIGRYCLGFEQQYDAKIRAALSDSREKQEHRIKGDGDDLQQILPGKIDAEMISPSEQRMRSPGYAIFLVGVNAKGRVEKLMAVDSLPDEIFAAGLEGVVRRSHFGTAKKSTELRWAFVPMSYDDQSVQLKNLGQ